MKRMVNFNSNGINSNGLGSSSHKQNEREYTTRSVCLVDDGNCL